MLQRLPPFAMIVGLSALYLGERAIGSGPGRLGLSGLGLALVVCSLVVAALRALRWEGERKGAGLRVLGHYGLAAAAVLLYFAQTPALALVPVGRVQTVVLVAWPALLLLGLLPALAMEAALAAMERTPTLEGWRVTSGGRAARIVVLALVAFAGVNFAAAKWSHKLDLSYFKTTKPGDSTLALVEGLTTPVELLLFYPPGNEVLEHARSYFDTLATKNPSMLTVRVVDQALDIDLSRDLKVRSNGYVVARSNVRTEQLKLDLELEDARPTLRNLDAEVQQRLLKVSRPTRIAYFTTGHLERDWTPMESDKRPGINDLKLILESQGFQVRRVGLAEGLGTQVPVDATLVVTVGPTEPFQPGEVEAMRRYLERGGKWLAFFDPDHGIVSDELVQPLGLQLGKALAAAESRFLVRVEGRGESPYFMATTQWASHPSTTTLGQGAGRLYVVALGAGTVKKRDDAPASAGITFTLRAMPESWEDVNGNGQLDEKTEKRDTVNLAAAVELKRPEGEPGRAVVAMDADMVTNGVVRNPGNAYLLVDTVKWLAGEEKIAGAVESEKDVPIVHKKDKDAVWFYGTSFVMPALVLAGGFFISRRTRGGRKEG